jgi:hypothetical protein
MLQSINGCGWRWACQDMARASKVGVGRSTTRGQCSMVQAIGSKVVRGHDRRSSSIVRDHGGPGSLTGLKAASAPLVVCSMDASIPCASIYGLA